MMTTLLTQENIILVFSAAFLTMTLAFTFELSKTISTMGDNEQ